MTVIVALLEERRYRRYVLVRGLGIVCTLVSFLAILLFCQRDEAMQDCSLEVNIIQK